MTILMQRIRNQTAAGYSPIILIVGKQRRGKTMFALTIAHTLEGNNFNMEEQLKVNALDICKAYDKYSGKVLIFDEGGKELDLYRAMDEVNRAISHVIQSQAYKRNVLIIISPFANEIGKGHRKHVDAVVEIYKRGAYRLYALYSWYADINDTPVRMIGMEDIERIPLPPPEVVAYYKQYKEKQTKQEILTDEIGKLERRKIKKEEEIYSTIP